MATRAQLILSMDSRGAKKGAQDFEQSATRVERSATKMSRAIGRYDAAAKKATRSTGIFAREQARLIAGFVGFTALIAGVRTISSYERSLSELRGVVNATADDMERLDETASRLGATTEFTATQSGQALTFLARAGFDVDESLSAVNSTLDLATAGLIGLAESADFASNIVQQFNLRAADTSRVADSLVNVSNNANTNVRQLAEALKFAGPVAGSLGRELEETAAAVGVLGNAGIQASLAGTNLRGFLAALSGLSTEARQALLELDVDLSRINPSANTLETIIQELSEASLDAATAFEVFGRRNAGAALVLSRSLPAYRELLAIQEDNQGAAKEFAEIVRGDLQGSLDTLKSAFEALVLEGGDSGLRGVIKGLTDGLTSFLRLSTEAVSALGFIDNGATAAGTALASLISGFLAFQAVNVAARIFNVVRGLDLMRVALIDTARAQRILNVAMRRNPIGLLVTLVASLTAALVGLDVAFSSTSEETKALEEANRGLADSYTQVERAAAEAADALARGDGAKAVQDVERAAEGLRGAIVKLRRETQGDSVGLGAVSDLLTSGILPQETQAILSVALDRESLRIAEGEIQRLRDSLAGAGSAGVFGKITQDISRLERAIDRANAGGGREGLLALIPDDQETISTARAIELLEIAYKDLSESLGLVETEAGGAARSLTDVERAALAFADAQSRINPTLVESAEIARIYAERVDELTTLAAQNTPEALQQSVDGFERLSAMIATAQEEYRRLSSEVDGFNNLSEKQRAQLAREIIEKLDAARADEERAEAVERLIEQMQEEERQKQAAAKAATENAAAIEREAEALRKLEEAQEAQRRARFENTRDSLTRESQIIGLGSRDQILEVELDRAGGGPFGRRFLTDREIATIESRVEVLKQRITEANVAEGIANSFTTAVGVILTEFDRLEDAIENFARSVQQVLLQELALEPLRNSLKTFLSGLYGSLSGSLAGGIGGGGGGGSSLFPSDRNFTSVTGAQGGVFNTDGFHPSSSSGAFALGTVINGPTEFSDANGRRALTGEAGPEALLALSKMSNGRLGVAFDADSAPGGDTYVDRRTYNIYGASDAKAFRRSLRQDRSDVRAQYGRS